MNVQNAKSLEIEEGDVKTIHDKDGKLLWGAVGYDTKYAGDTFQQTYSGKNLIPYPYASSSSSPRVSAGITFIDNGDGTITINGQNDGTGNSIYYLVGGGNTLTLPAGTYYANASAMYPTGGTITMYDGSSYRGLSLSNPSITLTQQTTFTSVYYQITRNNTLSLDNVKFYPIMSSVSGETVDNWEPYVGGTASPNPDYPQDVQTVTGTQTVTISDGNNQSEDFTVRLGSLELCKIGTYQDYIYKSGDDWYVHKETGKYTFTGSESWSTNSSWNYDNTSIYIIGGSYSASGSSFYCNYFTYSSTTYSQDKNGIFSIVWTNRLAYRVNNSIAPTVDDFKTWVSTHNLITYYQLATPIDTQITDSTLIGELEAIHEWMTRYGYQASVTGNLPMIIRQDALT